MNNITIYIYIYIYVALIELDLRIITQEGNVKTRQMTSFFSSTFSTLFVIFISEFENSQNSFSCGPSFGPFRSAKYLNF